MKRSLLTLTMFMGIVGMVVAQGIRTDHFTTQNKKVDARAIKCYTGFETFTTGQAQTPVSNDLRDPYFQIGSSWYDLQSNNGNSPRLWSDGGGNLTAVWTYAPNSDLAGSRAFPLRGTGINVMQNGVWGSEPTARIEGSTRTGWPNVVKDSDGNTIVIAHVFQTSAFGLYVSIQDANGDWTYSTVPTNTPYGVLWPRAAISGDGQTIHVVAITTPTANNNDIPSEYDGIDGHLLYFRSDDGGKTWPVIDQKLPGIDSSEYFQGVADSYQIAASGDNVAVGYFGIWSDVTIAKSEDKGETWNSFKVLDYPLDKYNVGDAYTLDQIGGPDTLGPAGANPGDSVALRAIYTSDRTGALAIDENGKVHVGFGAMYVSDNDFTDGAFYNYFFWNGIGYWNEDMMGERPIEIGGSTDRDGDDLFSLTGDDGDYVGKANSTFPSLAFGPDGHIYLAYSTMCEDLLDQNNAHYRHVYIMKSTDGGDTWTDTYDAINEETVTDEIWMFTEAVFPSIAVDERHLHLIYQQDYETSLYVRPETNSHLNFDQEISYLRFDKDNLTFVERVVSPEALSMSINPNPASDIARLSYALTSEAEVDIQIIGLDGKVRDMMELGKKSKGNQEEAIRLDNLSSGIYMVKLIANKQAATVKLVVK